MINHGLDLWNWVTHLSWLMQILSYVMMLCSSTFSPDVHWWHTQMFYPLPAYCGQALLYRTSNSRQTALRFERAEGTINKPWTLRTGRKCRQEEVQGGWSGLVRLILFIIQLRLTSSSYSLLSLILFVLQSAFSTVWDIYSLWLQSSTEFRVIKIVESRFESSVSSLCYTPGALPPRKVWLSFQFRIWPPIVSLTPRSSTVR